MMLFLIMNLMCSSCIHIIIFKLSFHLCASYHYDDAVWYIYIFCYHNYQELVIKSSFVTQSMFWNLISLLWTIDHFVAGRWPCPFLIREQHKNIDLGSFKEEEWMPKLLLSLSNQCKILLAFLCVKTMMTTTKQINLGNAVA